MNKLKLLWIIFILFFYVGCSDQQKEEKNNVINDDNIALTIDNKNKEEEKNAKDEWPQESGALSEVKGEKSYIYEGYNFDFGKDLPQKNYFKMERDIKTNICQVELTFPVDKKNSENININLTYNPKTKDITELKSNTKDISTSGISRQLSIIYNMVNSN